jgi:hypothetical protein
MSGKRLATVLSVFIIVILAGSSLNSGSAQAAPNYVEGTDPASVLFNPLQVHKISLQMSNSDYNSLRYPTVSWDNEGEWRPTQMVFTIGSKAYGPYKVGVHLKGAWGSWRDITGKAAFKIKMDAFVENQTFFGVRRMTLNNMVQDPSYIHEVLTYQLFRAVGVPASRTGYADVSLNGINYGLHLNVETLNPEMLKRWKISSSQMVKGAVPTFPDFWPGSETSFAIESGNKSSYSALSALIAANQFDGPAWWAQINQVADLEEMTLEWATELYTGHWDGYVLNKNNYFVNFDDQGKATILPWGTDQTWNGSYGYFNSAGLMLSKCLGSEECRELYLQSLSKVAKTAKNLNLSEMAKNVSAAISPAIARDSLGSGLEYAQAIQAGTMTQAATQLQGLSAMTETWDTSLSQISANGRVIDPERTIYLAPGTKNVIISIITSQPGALAALDQNGDFNAGSNVRYVTVTSADGAHKATKKLTFYVFTKHLETSKIKFVEGKSNLLPASKMLIKQLAAKLKNSDSLTLTLSMSQNSPRANSLLSRRSATILAFLKNQGITPMKVIKTLSTSGSSQTLSVSASYRN